MKTETILTASVALNALLIGSVGYFWIGRSGPTNLPLSAVVAKSTAPGPAPSAVAPRASGPVFFPAGASAPIPSSPPLSVAAATAPVIAFPGRMAPIATTSNNPTSPTAANAPTSVPVESSAPGNFLHFRGMRVAVAENLGTGPAGQPGLAVDVTPEAAAPTTGSEATSPNDNSSASAANDATASAEPSTASRRSSATGVSATAIDATYVADSATVPTDPTSETPRRSRLQVFTPEENLFRAKWGWAAFDLMRREAAREAANRETAAN